MNFDKSNALNQLIEEIQNKMLFLYFVPCQKAERKKNNLYFERMLFSEIPLNTEYYISFSKNAKSYTKEEILDIVFDFYIPVITFLEDDVAVSLPALEELHQSVNSFWNLHAKLEIFCIKRTLKKDYLAELTNEKVLVLANLKNNHLNYYSAKYEFDNKKHCTLIPAVTDMQELRYFTEQSDYLALKKQGYDFILVSISKIIKQTNLGLYINPYSQAKTGKDFKFAISTDFFNKYMKSK